MKKIAVIGAGYVGLVTGVCFAQKENFVTIIEKDSSKVNALLDGKVPFYEPGLDQLLKNDISREKIRFISSISEALKDNPQIIFSCVGTTGIL